MAHWIFDDAETAALAAARDCGGAPGPGLGPVRPARCLEGPGRAAAGPAGDRAAAGWKAAHRRLTALAARPGALGGAADYWLGVCEALGGRPDAALRAFARVPEGYAFDPLGAYLEAKANLSQGRLHAAERRLEQALARGGPGLDQVRDLLSEIYQIEVRFDDVKALLRASLAEAEDPIRDLKELEQPRPGSAALRRPEGGPGEGRPTGARGRPRLARQGPTGDRGRPLGRGGRLARALPRGRADAPVWRAWLEWARGSGRPDEALDAARQLGPGQLELGERLALRAWLASSSGATREAESAALERWLRLEPAATRALERLAELAHRAGQPDRVADLRRRKAEVERAMAAYRDRLWSDEPLRTAAERSELARLAEAAGRRHEARALYHLGAQGRSRRSPPPGRAWPGSIGPTPSGSSPSPRSVEPWPEVAPATGPRARGPGSTGPST